MKMFYPLRPLVTALLLAASVGAMASGSDGAGSAETGDAQAYNVGKMVYSQKVACSGCAMAGKTLDAAMARQLLSGKSIAGLTEEESRALAVYLTRRFRL